MSDRSALSLIVYDCPPKQRAAVLDIIASYNLTEDFGLHTVGEDSELRFGEVYGDDEMRLDGYAEIAGELMTKAPGSTFRVWNDPKYEWLGGLMMYAPGLGAFSHNCDADGNPVFTVDEMLETIKVNSLDYLKQQVGKPWLDRMKELDS